MDPCGLMQINWLIDMPVLWRTCCAVDQYAALLSHAFASVLLMTNSYKQLAYCKNVYSQGWFCLFAWLVHCWRYVWHCSLGYFYTCWLLSLTYCNPSYVLLFLIACFMYFVYDSYNNNNDAYSDDTILAAADMDCVGDGVWWQYEPTSRVIQHARFLLGLSCYWGPHWIWSAGRSDAARTLAHTNQIVSLWQSVHWLFSIWVFSHV